MLFDLKNEKSRKLESKFTLFFRKQQAKILRKLNNNDEDFDKMFDQEHSRMLNYFKDEVKDLSIKINSTLSNTLNGYNSVEINDDFIENVTKNVSKCYKNEAKDLLLNKLDGSDDKFSSTKEIYSQIRDNIKYITDDFVKLTSGVILAYIYSYQKDVDSKYFLE